MIAPNFLSDLISVQELKNIFSEIYMDFFLETLQISR